jgi:Ca-activated chloride channel family protein
MPAYRSISLLLVAALAATGCSASALLDRDRSTPQAYEHPAPDEYEYEYEDEDEEEDGYEDDHEDAEPPYADVTFDDPGTNPFEETDDDPLSTFAMDVDTGSYTVARRFLGDGHLPDPESVRIEEYVNYHDQGYEPPDEGTFAVHVDGAPTPFLSEEGDVLVRVGLKGVEVADEDRLDATLTFVIDVSGSMAMEQRLGLVQRSLGLLVDRLRPDDAVAIVVYGTDARVVLEPTSAAEPEVIRDAIDQLLPEGSTNAQAGLELGYELARRAFRPGAINRVILASDGVANVGVTDPHDLLERIEDDAERGIELVTVGFGMGNFNDALMEQLADGGDGFYAYVDDLDEAERLFEEELTGTLETVARDARVQVEFDSRAVERYRLVGFENRAIDDEDFDDVDVDAGEIGAGHSVTALYELELGDSDDHQLGTVEVRWRDARTDDEERLSVEIDRDDLIGAFEEASARFQLAATVGAWGEALRESRWGDGISLDEVAGWAGALAERLPDDGDVAEFADLARQAARLAGDRR